MTRKKINPDKQWKEILKHKKRKVRGAKNKSLKKAFQKMIPLINPFLLNEERWW